MERRMSGRKLRFGILCLVLALVFMAGCANTVREVREVKFDRSAVDPAAIQPGLAVLYFKEFYRGIDQMPIGEKALKEGKPGKPIPYLNHHFNAGPVFDSGLNRGVGVQMTGFIRFPSSGRYLFKAKSNDGIRILINGKMIIDDPSIHMRGDRFSEEASVDVEAPGWHPFFLQFFQYKGTSMLELHWQTPGQTGFRVLPAEAFGHIPPQ